MAKNNYGSRRGRVERKRISIFLSRVPRKASLGRGSLTGRSRGRMSAWGIKIRRVVE